MNGNKDKKFIAVAVALVKRGDEILMTLRNEKALPEAHLKWELPGGKIDFGETPEQALIREIREETGYTVKIIDKNPIIRTHIWEYPTLSLHALCLGYKCKVVDEQKPKNDPSIKAIAWKKIRDLDYSQTLRGTKEFLEAMRK
ncbi:MAG: NUDIX hydrolase [Candidatus Wildermuthbacteria bacterium]|nr:NUDIX hydrolase [Candidatus Wildermuthbacteria bacterium]